MECSTHIVVDFNVACQELCDGVWHSGEGIDREMHLNKFSLEYSRMLHIIIVTSNVPPIIFMLTDTNQLVECKSITLSHRTYIVD